MSPATRPGGSQQGDLTVKQQRAAKRDAKLAKYHQERARAKRNRRIGLIGGIVAVVAVIGLIAATVFFTPRPARYEAGSEGVEIAGVETFENASEHVETPVTYPQTPPAGGQHSATWLNCGVYTEPVPNENATHALEHGAIWVTYDPAEVTDDDIAKLRSLLPATHAILSPFEGMDSPVTLSGWNVQLALDEVDEQQVSAFFEEYWIGENATEPGASCSGGVDGPGKVA